MHRSLLSLLLFNVAAFSIVIHSQASGDCNIVDHSFVRFHRVKIDQECSQNQRWQDDQARFGTERAACPKFGTVDIDPGQRVDIQPGDGKSKHNAFEEIPADVQSDREPELLRADVAIGQINSCKENPCRADPGRVWVAEMKKTKHSRGNDDTPE